MLSIRNRREGIVNANKLRPGDLFRYGEFSWFYIFPGTCDSCHDGKTCHRPDSCDLKKKGLVYAEY